MPNFSTMAGLGSRSGWKDWGGGGGEHLAIESNSSEVALELL